MKLSDHTLLRLHVEAVWHVRFATTVRDDVELLPRGEKPPWKLCVAELAAGQVSIWRPDVAPLEREALRLRASEALALPPLSAPLPGVQREVALSLTASPRMNEVTAHGIARPLIDSDRALVEAFEADAQDYYFHPDRQPLIGVVISGQLLCLAHSSRRTAEACELGIETHASARQRGYGLAATIVWTQAVLQEGLVPIYSADASNTASLHLAASAGYRPFARLVTLV